MQMFGLYGPDESGKTVYGPYHTLSVASVASATQVLDIVGDWKFIMVAGWEFVLYSPGNYPFSFRNLQATHHTCQDVFIPCSTGI